MTQLLISKGYEQGIMRSHNMNTCSKQGFKKLSGSEGSLMRATELLVREGQCIQRVSEKKIGLRRERGSEE